jgi:hypothetical protein
MVCVKKCLMNIFFAAPKFIFRYISHKSIFFETLCTHIEYLDVIGYYCQNF